MRKSKWIIVIMVSAMLFLSACGKGKDRQTQTETVTETGTQTEMVTENGTQTEKVTETETQSESVTESETQSQSETESESQVVSQKPYSPVVPAQKGVGICYEVKADAPWIAIDAGHQLKGNYEKEPLGPGSDQLKAKVASGTQGRFTGVAEYQLTLDVSLQLRDALMEKGYNVLMIRETNEVNISNAERAVLANEKGVAAFLRIHADGAENTSASGITVLCQSVNNPYCGGLYSQSRRLSDCLSASLIKATDAKNRGVSEVDNMTGINYCQVPVAIIEMGFMTNEREDRLMQTAEYRAKLVSGMVEGVIAFLN